MDDPRQTRILLDRAASGDAQALNELFERHRERLLRMAQFRLDSRLRGRIDPADVVQETHLEAIQRFGAYLSETDPMPFFHWLRFLTDQKLCELQRRHLGAQRRDVRKEVRFAKAPRAGVSSVAMAERLHADQQTPSQAASADENRRRIREALDSMDPLDCEVISLRGLEQLSNAEVALELGIHPSAASKRWLRALERLTRLLEERKDD